MCCSKGESKAPRWCLAIKAFTFQYFHISIFSYFLFSARENCVIDRCVAQKVNLRSISLALMPGYLFPPLNPPPTRGQTIAEIWKTIIKEIWNRKGKPLTDSLTQWPIHKIFGGEIPQNPDYTSNQHASSCNTKRRNKKTKIHEEYRIERKVAIFSHTVKS